MLNFSLSTWLTMFGLALFSTSFSQEDHLILNLEIEGTIANVEAHYQAHVTDVSDALYVLLNPGFNDMKIEAEGLINYEMTQRPDRPFPFWLLKFEENLPTNEPIDLYFKYHFDLETTNHLKSDWIELNVDKMWFPNLNDIDNEFTYHVTVRGLPENYTLISHVGNEVESTHDAIIIKRDKPAAETLILAGADMKRWSTTDSIVIYGRNTIPDSTFESIGQKIKHSIALMNRSFGAAKPLTSFTVILRNTTVDEINFQFSRENLIVTGVEFNSYANLSHEVAHYWWSLADFINEPWLNESFANYSMYLVLQKYAPDTYDRIYKRYEKRATEAIPVSQARLFGPKAYDSYYLKGSVLLKNLEHRIGLEKMLAVLSDAVSQEVDSTKKFLDILEANTDRATRDYFEAELEK